MARLVGVFSVLALFFNIRQTTCQGNARLGFRAPPTVPFPPPFQPNFPFFNPLFFRDNNNLPQPDAQFRDICFAVTGRFAPFGCSYVPNLINPISNVILNCRLDCSDIEEFQPIQLLNFFRIINPGYLTTGNYNIVDQSNLDVFVGDSYDLFQATMTNPTSRATVIVPTTILITTTTTTTTVPATTTTTASTTTTRTPTTPATTTPPTTIQTTTTPTTTTPATTMTTKTPTTTTPATTTVTIPTAILSPEAVIIAQCIAKQCAPAPGGTYIGTGTGSSNSLTCAFKGGCVDSPFLICANQLIPPTNAEQCALRNGAPPAGCTYAGTGLLFPTLTCPILCAEPGCVPVPA